MSDELGFAHPEAILKARNKLYVGGAVVFAVAIVFMDLPPSPILIIGVVALLAAPIVIDAFLVRRKFVFLSSDGIRGIDASGRKTSVRWSDPVEIESGPYFKWPGVRLIREDGSHIVLPLAMTSSPEFREALERCAPRDHALPRALKTWSSS
jgi:hypothetical protein